MSLRRKIYYTLHSGKNSKLGYYTAAYLRMAVPGPLARGRLAALLRNAERRPDYAEMLRRRDYYCRLEPGTPPGPEARPLNDLTRTAQSVYWLDTCALHSPIPAESATAPSARRHHLCAF